MKPAVFIFADDECTSCVYVHECDDEKALRMIGKTLASPCSSTKLYDPLDITTTFVAANKTRPFDMLFVGDFEQDECELEGITKYYEVRKSEFYNSLQVVPIDTTKGDPTDVWVIRGTMIH
tara:strand:- start:2781 stop:3143 length:363 start_codon:yes stop_codon:yes gene_type:complete